MNNKHDIVKKKYQDLLTLLDFGYTTPVSFCCVSETKNSQISNHINKKKSSQTFDISQKCLSNNKNHVPFSLTENSHYSFGCGDPIGNANLQKDEIALDLGCGCGNDALRAAHILASLRALHNYNLNYTVYVFFINLLFKRNFNYAKKNFKISYLQKNMIFSTLDFRSYLSRQTLQKLLQKEFYSAFSFTSRTKNMKLTKVKPSFVRKNVQSKYLSEKEFAFIKYLTKIDSHKKSIQVIAIDMLPEMLERAKREAIKQNLKNIEFKQAYIEDLPLNDNSVDVIFSNCVINLSPEKFRVFQEAYRVLRKQNLKPNQSLSRVLFSDIVSDEKLPSCLQENSSMKAKLWGACMGGVIPKKEYMRLMQKAGFSYIEILHEQKLSQEHIFSIFPKAFPKEEFKHMALSKILIRAYPKTQFCTNKYLKKSNQ